MIMNTIMMTFRRLSLILLFALTFSGCCLFPPTDPIVIVKNPPYSGKKLGKYIANNIYIDLIKAPDVLFADSPPIIYFETFNSDDDLANEVNSQLVTLLKKSPSLFLTSSKGVAKYILKGTELYSVAKIQVKLILTGDNKTVWSYRREFEDHR